MAGLPCEACQEPLAVIPNAAVVTDAADRAIYRRYRTCTNPACELYLMRRETFEVAAPLAPDAPVVSPGLHNLRGLKLRPRTAPAPDWLGLPGGD